MNKVKLLDCTLRDGAYVVDSEFGSGVIRGILNKLQEANVDIIECGWLKNSPHKPGTSFYHVPGDLEQYLVGSKNPGCLYTVMIDWDRYDLSALPPRDNHTIDAIRVVFPMAHHQEGIELAGEIKEKGYQVFFQAANSLGYSDSELLKMVDEVNQAQPSSLSIVDTFGAMYPQDLQRIVTLVDHNLDPKIQLGFHSHNNLQLSYALGIEFLRCLSESQRGLIIDSSLCGMGRGAGNAPTELIAYYLNKFQNASYDMNRILDAIDMYMGYFLEHYEWGYSTQYFISGSLCAHVNNIYYLTKTHRVNARDMRAILESMPADKRTVYDYDALEEKYVEYQSRKIDDGVNLATLAEAVRERNVLLLSPGESIKSRRDIINDYIAKNMPVVIGINAAFPGYNCDYLFFSNAHRLDYARETHPDTDSIPLLITSNIKTYPYGKETLVFNYDDYIKLGWEFFDNSTIMCLRLLQKVGAERVALAGFDGFDEGGGENYADSMLQTRQVAADVEQKLNREIEEMLADFLRNSSTSVSFLTPSRYETAFIAQRRL